MTSQRTAALAHLTFALFCAGLLGATGCGTQGATDFWGDVGPVPVGDAGLDGALDVTDTTPDVLDADAGEVGDADAEIDAPDVLPGHNACGGVGSLSLDGRDAIPGSACGCAGTVVCNGTEAVVCAGADAPNVCGGCVQLEAVPGDRCGECGDGTAVCREGGLACEGATSGNLCGGCSVLPAAPRALCAIGGETGIWVCVDGETLTCALASESNACGGVGELVFEGLSANPGEPCEGACGAGRLVCDTAAGSLACNAPEANLCGGCGELARAPIGVCGCGDRGHWDCDDSAEGGIRCFDGETNACGGCGTLAPRPGEACEDGGVVVCDGADDTACVDAEEPLNACGGSTTLPTAPGTECGACGSGSYRCVGREAVSCEGDLGSAAFNDCGGCGPSVGVVGAACGVCALGVTACDGEASSCSGDPGDDARDACGGCSGTATQIGDACGSCAVWACAGGALECTFDFESPECVEVPANCSDIRCEDDSRVCIPGELGSSAACGECLIGFVESDGVCVGRECVESDVDECTDSIGEWSECAWASECATTADQSRTTVPIDCVAGLCRAGTAMTDTRACAPRETEGLRCGENGLCVSEACVELPAAPVVTASTTSPLLRVEWGVTSYATGYQVEIDASGTWVDLGPALAYTDTAAAVGAITPCSGSNLTASQGTVPAYVDLRCSASSTSPGPTRQYRVRGYNAVGVGPASAPATGRIAPGVIAYQWQSAASASDEFGDLVGATTSNWQDTTAPSSGAPVWYKVRLTAQGAASAVSTSVSGFRMPAPPAPTVTATTTRLTDVRVTWTSVAGATSYELEIDGSGVWVPVSGGSYDDTAAGAPVITPCTPVVSQGTFVDRVEGSCSASHAEGPTRSYRVRAVGAAGTSDPSAPASGSRAAGPLSYGWEFSSSSSTGFATLAGATAATFVDTSAPSDGTPRWYRAVVRASGAADARSVSMDGWINVHRTDVGGACLENADCTSRNCSSGYCAPTGFVYVAPDAYLAGSPTDEVGRPTWEETWEESQRWRAITRGFFLQAAEVTQGEWQSLMGNNPSSFAACGSTCPVETVTWFDAVTYANRRSDAEGLDRCYTLTGCSGTIGAGCGTGTSACDTGYSCTVGFVGPACNGYRLPTEAEWELAYRAGTSTGTYAGDLGSPSTGTTAVRAAAWFADNAGETTHAVRGKTPNALGVYDMAGNVWEWVTDTYADRGVFPGAQDAVQFAATGESRMRGGFWRSPASDIRAAARASAPRTAANHDRGFRLVRVAGNASCDELGCAAANRTCSVADGVATCGACIAGNELDTGACYPTLQRPALTASVDREADVLLSWAPVAQATGYLVTVNGTPVEVGSVTSYTDATAADPAPVACETLISASRSTAASVALTCTGSRVGLGPTSRYTVRARYYSEHVGRVSTAADGGRFLDATPSLQWQYLLAGTWVGLTGATRETATDVTAPTDGSVRRYRVAAEYRAVTTYSDEVEGSRKLQAPSGLSATGSASSVALSWSARTGAASYSVIIGSGTPFTVTGTSYTDTTAPAPVTIGTCTSMSGSTTVSGQINVGCSGANFVGSTVRYYVAGVTADGYVGDYSYVDSRRFGTVNYQWQRAAAGSTSFSNRSGATSSTYSDTGVTASTSYDYRVLLSATGATTVTSATVRGTAGP